MLVDLNRRIFKITAFFCVVVSVFSDGRMGFYRGGLLSAAYGGGRFAVLWRKCGYAMGICCGGMVVAVARISGDVWMPGSRERFAGLSRR